MKDGRASRRPGRLLLVRQGGLLTGQRAGCILCGTGSSGTRHFFFCREGLIDSGPGRYRPGASPDKVVVIVRFYILSIPLLVAVVTLVYIILREMTRVWLEHRVKMLLLERLEDRPDLLYSFQDLQQLLDGRPADKENAGKSDLSVTGLFLALIGLIFVIVNAVIGSSQWGVGAYFGGVACVAIGFILTTIGLVARLLRRPPK